MSAFFNPQAAQQTNPGNFNLQEEQMRKQMLMQALQERDGAAPTSGQSSGANALAAALSGYMKGHTLGAKGYDKANNPASATYTNQMDKGYSW